MSAEAIRLRDRYEIRFDQPLPAVASAGTTAYAAHDTRSPGPPLVAIVPNLQFPPRVAPATAIRTMRQPALWTPTEWGVVDCPPMGRRSWVIVGDFPDGGRLVTETEGKFPAWDEADIKQKLLLPLLPGLKALSVDGIAHRAIRLSNIWYRDQQRRIVLLGDGISTPAALHQPVVYEPIESGLTDPAGRGEGRVGDDFYALGVLIAHLMSGQIPCDGLSDDEILDRKIAQGSLAALTADLRLSTGLGDLCRGLLSDNHLDRWGITELSVWLDGRRVPFKPPSHDAVATRPYPLGTVSHLTTRGLARAMVEQGENAAEAVHDKGLQTWLQRALPASSKTRDLFPRALADGEEGDPNSRVSRLVARAAIALDPAAPIRYRGIATQPDGLATLLTATSLGKDPAPGIKIIAELLRGRLVQFWTDCQADSRLEYDIWSRDHDRLRLFLVDHRPGSGIERVTYELSPRLHCLSPAIEMMQVTSIEELLPALEQAAELGRITALVADRHVAAFIASRTKLYSDSLGTMLGHADPAERVLGALALLGRVQNDYGPAKLRELSALFRPQVAPLINRLHSRTARRQLQNATDEAIASGRLPALLQALDNPEARTRDQQQFTRAVARCAEAQRDIRACARELERAPEQGAETAHTMAALVAAMTGAVVTGLALFSAWTS